MPKSGASKSLNQGGILNNNGIPSGSTSGSPGSHGSNDGNTTGGVHFQGKPVNMKGIRFQDANNKQSLYPLAYTPAPAPSNRVSNSSLPIRSRSSADSRKSNNDHSHHTFGSGNRNCMSVLFEIRYPNTESLI